MDKCCVKCLRLVAAMLVLAQVAAAQHGGDSLVLVVDSRRFTGFSRWWAGVYNESRVYFTLLTIITVPALGWLMGKLTSFVLSRTGINLKSRVLTEH